MHRAVKFINDWALPLAIVLGLGSYIIYRACGFMHPAGPVLHSLASSGQRWVIAFLLFFQFVKVSPHDLHLDRWHLGALAIQIGLFGLLAWAVSALENPALRIPAECAMICFICPTASAAGVITEKIGGKLSSTVSYLVLINIAATLLIPLIIPMVAPSSTLGFWSYVWHLAMRVFPVLILPCLLAWTIRYTMPQLRRKLVRWSSCSLYIWCVGLYLAMVLSLRALILSGLPLWVILVIVGTTLACCAFQFFAGRRLGARSGDPITPGQALGQKNTGFLIWLGYSYLTPVTSVAGGLYAIFQNLFNSWELYRAKKDN